MLDEEQYIALSKPDTLQIYANVNKKLEEKEKFVENTITKFTSLMEDGFLREQPTGEYEPR